MSFEVLRKLINHRVQVERENVVYPRNSDGHNPYKEYPTDVNFLDIDGKSLLQYAVEEGRIEEVKQLVTEGINGVKADINLGSPIKIALEKGQLEIAQYLYQQGANCSEIFLKDIENSDCRKWYSQIAKESFDTYLNDKKNSDTLTKAPPPILEKFSLFSLSTALSIGVEIGVPITDIKYLIGSGKTHFSYRQGISSVLEETEIDRLLCLAAANGQLEIIKFLLHEGVRVNPRKIYSSSALEFAIEKDQLDAIEFLVAQGADINWLNERKHNALMVAVENKNESVVEWLIQYPINTDQTDIEGNNVLHLAVIAGNISNLETLLKNESLKLKLNEKNIYGQSPLDLAVSNNQPDIISLLSSGIEGPLPHKKSPQKLIDHGSLLDKIFYYLRKNYRDTTILFPDATTRGKCNGFSYLYNYYAAKGMEDYFFSTLAMIAGWDGTDEMLDTPFDANAPQSAFYKNLRELFEQWINDLAFFQNPEYISIENNVIGKNEKEYQKNLRAFQYDLAGYEPEYKPRLIFSTLDFLDKNQIKEILSYFKQMPSQTQLEISNGPHKTAAHLNQNQAISYYDVNTPYRLSPMNNVDDCLENIINMMYIVLDEYHSGSRPFFAGFYFFVPSKYEAQFNHYDVFSKNSDLKYPTSLRDAKQFQENSPNQFTHLHVAVITRSVTAIKNLLRDGYCDLSAKDFLGNTALDLAIENGFQSAVDLLKQYAKDPREFCISNEEYSQKASFMPLFSKDTNKVASKKEQETPVQVTELPKGLKQ